MGSCIRYIRNRFFAHVLGHFYSPVPKVSEIKKDEKRIFETNTELVGINLNADEQIDLLRCLSKFTQNHSFPMTKTADYRYYFNNSWFGGIDALILYAVIRWFSPKRIIEVGSGFSSCVMLDTNQHFFNSQIHLTFVEPNPKRLLSNVLPKDNYTLYKTKVQNIDKEIFG